MKVFFMMVMFAVMASTVLSSPHGKGQVSSEEAGTDTGTDAFGASAQQGSRPSRRNKNKKNHGGGSHEANDQSKNNNNNDGAVDQANNKDYTNTEDAALLQRATAQKSQAKKQKSRQQNAQRTQQRNSKPSQAANSQNQQRKQGGVRNTNKRRSTKAPSE